MPVQKFPLSITDALMSELAARGAGTAGERSGTIGRQLERYFDLLRRNRSGLRAMFADNESGLILDALNGILFTDPMGVLFSPEEIIESLPDLAEKWSVAPEALTRTLRLLSPADCFALVDAVERWWNRVAAGESPNYSELFK